MSLSSVTHLNIDFSDKKYISIDAKQHDKNSRFVLITCYDHGEVFYVDGTKYSAYVRYRKPNDFSVFKTCEITDGEVLFELTEQMLASSGICYADFAYIGQKVADKC